MEKFFISFLILFQISYPQKLKNIYRNFISNDNEITIKVNASGIQYILSERFDFDLLPDEVYLNGSKIDFINKRQLNLEKGLNIITLKWNQTITSCKNMFKNLNNISEIDLSKFETSSISSMESMFYGCKSLISINFTNFDTSNVSTFFNMFKDCSALESLDLSYFNTSKITNMEYMFYGCKKLKVLNLSTFYTPNLQNMDYIFSQCSDLTYLDLSNFNTSKVNNMTYVFQKCKSLSYIDLSNFDTYNVQMMDYMFDECTSLVSLYLSNFNTSNVIRMKCMFQNCIKLASIDLSNFNMSKNTNMGLIFKGCKELSFVNLSNIDTSNIIFMDNMFNGCQKLKSLDLSGFITSKVQKMEYMFNGCTSLISLDLSNFDFSSITRIENMFLGCKNLKYINLINATNISKYHDIFYKISGNPLTCINDEIKEVTFQGNKCKVFKCSENISRSKEVNDIQENFCKNGTQCSFSNLLYEYKNECFIECPKNTYNFGYLCIQIQTTIIKISDTHKAMSDEIITTDYRDIKIINEIDNYKTESFLKVTEKSAYYEFSDTIINNDNPKETTFIFDVSNKENENSEFNQYTKTEKETFQEYKETSINNESNKDTFINSYEFHDTISNSFQNNYTLFQTSNLNTSDYNTEQFNSNKYQETIINTEQKVQIGLETLNLFNYSDGTEENTSYKSQETNTNIELFTNQITKVSSFNDYNNFTEILNPDYEKTLISTEMNNHKIIKTIPDLNTYDIISKTESTQNTFCDIKKFLSKQCKNNYKDKNELNDFTNNIIDKIMDGSLNNVLNSIIKENKSIIIEEDNEIHQITTLSKQNDIENLTVINFGECEKILRAKYEMSDNEELIIYKIEHLIEGYKIPIIEYVIFNEDGSKKLNLDCCNNITIRYNIPISINDNELDKYDSSSNYYTDKCNKISSDGIDMTLYDRKNEYNNKNMSLCEFNCTYQGYNKSTSKVECNCSPKGEMDYSKRNELLNKISAEKKSTNFDITKCANIFKDEEQLASNSGFFILLFILAFFLVIFIIFCTRGKRDIIDKIDGIIYKQTKENKNNKKKVKIIKKQKNNNNNNNIINSIKCSNKSKRKSERNKIRKIKVSSNITNPPINLIESSIKKYRKKNNTKISKQLNDYELNNLNYKEALNYDKRTYCEYYFSLIKAKQILIFSLCNNNDYNSGIIKKYIILQSFAFHYTSNAVFFNDETMHQIVEDEGDYNFSYQIPFILLSVVISTFCQRIFLLLIMTEKDVVKFKDIHDKNLAEKQKEKTIKYINIKYMIFFILNVILLSLFWYYLTCFNAIYENTQLYLIENTLIGF